MKRVKFAVMKPLKEGEKCPICHQKVYLLDGKLLCACIEIDECGNLL